MPHIAKLIAQWTVLLFTIGVVLVIHHYYMMPPPASERPIFHYWGSSEMSWRGAWHPYGGAMDGKGTQLFYDEALNLVVAIATQDPDVSGWVEKCTPQQAILFIGTEFEQVIERQQDVLLVIIPKRGIRAEFPISPGQCRAWNKANISGKPLFNRRCVFSNMVEAFQGEVRAGFCKLVTDNMEECGTICAGK